MVQEWTATGCRERTEDGWSPAGDHRNSGQEEMFLRHTCLKVQTKLKYFKDLKVASEWPPVFRLVTCETKLYDRCLTFTLSFPEFWILTNRMTVKLRLNLTKYKTHATRLEPQHHVTWNIQLKVLETVIGLGLPN